MKKKKLMIIFLVTAVLLVPVIIYMCQTKWVGHMGAHGRYSPDTYMGYGGEGMGEYYRKSRVHYKVNINKGCFHYDITDESGNTLAELNLNQSEEGYLYLDNTEKQVLYDHSWAIADEEGDADISFEIWVEYRISNFKLFINALCRKFNIIGPSW